MKPRFWLALGLFVVTGCSGAGLGLFGNDHDDPRVDIDFGFCGGGEDLAWQYVVLLHVKDAVTGANVPYPTFTVDGQDGYGRCLDTYNPDFGDECDGWALNSGGAITVSADGYADVTLAVDTKGPPGPCGPTVHQVEISVKMQPK